MKTLDTSLKNVIPWHLKLNVSEQKNLAILMKYPIDFINNKHFSRPSVMKPIIAQEINVPQGVTPSAEEEKVLFTQLNYSRYKMGQVRRRILRRKPWRPSDVKELLQLNQWQLEIRSKIVTANMGLVLAMVHRSHYHGVEFVDLVSEGSMALLRATEKFNCDRGIKFSTYACRAIFKSFSRAAKQSYRYRDRYSTQLDLILEKSDYLEVKRTEKHLEWVDEVRIIIDDNLAELSNIERFIIGMRFGLNDQQGPSTLYEIGERLELTKERIRQIQNKALKKIREVVEERMKPV